MLGLSQGERESIAAGLWQALAPLHPPAHLSTDGLETLVRAGHRLGFHTRMHPVLTQLEPEELAKALGEGVESVAAVAGERVDAIAYPYGVSDARVREATATAGFSHAFTTEPRVVTPTSDPLRLGRIDAASGSSRIFALRLARALSSVAQ
jgi:peptidoglycan/xylan/chitin deacetylase (PgdA/CDA1 family)